jgi:hypothetical protein
MAKSAPSMQEMDEKVTAFAEQLGRIVGTVQGKAEGWLERQTLKDDLTNVRDTAARLLQQLAGGSATKKKSTKKKAGASARRVDNSRIAKVKIAKEAKHRGGR